LIIGHSSLLIPLILFFVIQILRKRSNSLFLKPNSWVLSFEYFYVTLAIALFLVYMLGLTNESGQSLVRFYTLLSFPALIGVISAGSILATPLCSYLLLINASFFLATLNMYPAYILELMRSLGKS